MSQDTKHSEFSTTLTPQLALVLEGSLFLLTSLLLPLYLLFSLTRSKLRQDLGERLGGGAWRNAEMNQPDVLIHAASVGEVNGIQALLAKLKEEHPEYSVVISTTSLTGRARARELLGTNKAALFTLDHPLIQRQLLKRLRPKQVIISETELWPCYLLALQAYRIPVVLINARISDYSFPNYSKFRFLLKPLLNTFSLILSQSRLDGERFEALGAEPERVRVLGSTKYDREVLQFTPEQRLEFAQELGVETEKLCFVAGSVRPGEDGVVIDAYIRAKSEVPELQLILTPRHPERFDACAKLLEERGLEYHRRSAGQAERATGVVLLDTLGELQAVYSLASFSFVGATLVDIGGHNPLEPAAYSAPVLLGPYYSTVRDAVATLEQANAVRIVQDGAELYEAIRFYCQNEQERKAAGERAKEAWKRNLGATQGVLNVLSLKQDAALQRRSNSS